MSAQCCMSARPALSRGRGQEGRAPTCISHLPKQHLLVLGSAARLVTSSSRRARAKCVATVDRRRRGSSSSPPPLPQAPRSRLPRAVASTRAAIMCKVEERPGSGSKANDGGAGKSKDDTAAAAAGQHAWLILLSTMLDTMCMALIIPVQAMVLKSLGESAPGARRSRRAVACHRASARLTRGSNTSSTSTTRSTSTRSTSLAHRRGRGRASSPDT